MSNLGNNSHGNIRSDFPGGWPGDLVNGFTGEGLTEKQKDIQDFFRKVLRWRYENEVVHQGDLMHFAPRNGVYVYFRYNEEQKVMVVLNKTHREQAVAIEQFAEMLQPGDQGTELITGLEIVIHNSFSIGAKTALIIELKK
jgi:glycosidase